MFGNVAFRLQCKYEKFPKILIALPNITCLTAAAEINVSVVMGGHWTFLTSFNRETQPFKYDFISMYREPTIYNFTAIVKVLFHLFFVLTRNLRITRMLHYCFRCQCFPVSNHIWCTCTNSAVSFNYRNICLQPFRFSGLCIYCWRHAEQTYCTPFACDVEEYIFLLTRFRTKSSFISNHRTISYPCNIRVLF
jgi:hypothetical protein